MTRFRSASSIVAITLILTACVGGGSAVTPRNDTPPWKANASAVTITAAPDAGGPLSFRNCPTLDEARTAIPMIVNGPDADGVPFKTMVLQCSYSMAELDVQGRPAGVGILVFDAQADGRGKRLWDSVRTDPNFPGATDLPGLAEVGFTTGDDGQLDLWVVQGDFGFHMTHTRPKGVSADQMTALARAMLSGLERPPR